MVRRTSSPAAAEAVGRAITERLAPPRAPWSSSRSTRVLWSGPSRSPGVHAVVGSAAELDVAREAARSRRGARRQLTGWVNNAAVFRDADLPDDPVAVLDLVRTNLASAVVGCSVAVSAFVAVGAAGIDRERLVAPGASSRARRPPLRHGQGRDRRPDPRGRRRPRAAGRALQRGGTGLDHHRALRGVPRPPTRPAAARGRGAGGAAAPGRSCRTARRGRGGHRVPARPPGARLRQRCGAPGRRRARGVRPGPARNAELPTATSGTPPTRSTCRAAPGRSPT